jgi:hypothetical protein
MITMKATTKTPREFAKLMLGLYNGNLENAQIELYNAARAYSDMPCSFFHDCAMAMRAMHQAKRNKMVTAGSMQGE